MNREQLIASIVSGAGRKRAAPAEPRGLCPSCGKKGLGNTYSGHSVSARISGAYRQCRYCDDHVAV